PRISSGQSPSCVETGWRFSISKSVTRESSGDRRHIFSIPTATSWKSTRDRERSGTDLAPNEPAQAKKRSGCWGGRAAGGAVDRVAVHLPGILNAACAEADFGAVHLAADGNDRVAAFQCAADHLKTLLDRQISLGGLPGAIHFRGNDPQMRSAPVIAAFHGGGLVVLPVLHVEGVGHDAGARLQVQDFR